MRNWDDQVFRSDEFRIIDCIDCYQVYSFPEYEKLGGLGLQQVSRGIPG